MRIAIFSDIHGNIHALNAVLEDIRSFNADVAICAGDILNPLPASRETYELIRELKIPCIRGNHEDYIIQAHSTEPSPIQTDIQFQPVRLVANTFFKNEIEELKRLPLHISIKHPSGKNVLVCHASPNSNKIGYLNEITPELETELLSFEEKFIVCGHWHRPTTKEWKGKTLVIAGSVGIPMQEVSKAEYVQLICDGEWQVNHVQVPYNREQAAKEYIESGFVKEGGPIAWLLLDEIISSTRRLAYFFPWLNTKGPKPEAPSDWEAAVIEFLLLNKRWDAIGALVR